MNDGSSIRYRRFTIPCILTVYNNKTTAVRLVGLTVKHAYTIALVYPVRRIVVSDHVKHAYWKPQLLYMLIRQTPIASIA